MQGVLVWMVGWGCSPENTLVDAETTPSTALMDTADTAAGFDAPPSAPVLQITPLSPSAEDDVLCSIAVPGVDPEGAAVSHTLYWTNSGRDVTEPTLDAERTVEGETWLCLAWASDGHQNSDIAEAAVLIGPANRAPSAPVVEVSPIAPPENADLTCTVLTPSTDPDGDDITYVFRWFSDDVAVDGVTLDRGHTTEGEVWSCAAYASDGLLKSAESVAADTITAGSYSEDLTGGQVYDASGCEYCPDEDWYIPDKAFDDVNGSGADGWYTVWSGGPEWISIDFGVGNERAITRYGLTGASFHEGYSARSWALQGSDDQHTWTTLHTVKDATLEYVMWGGEALTYFSFSNTVPHRHYRLWITENNGGQPHHDSVGIVEIEMFEDDF